METGESGTPTDRYPANQAAAFPGRRLADSLHLNEDFLDRLGPGLVDQVREDGLMETCHRLRDQSFT
ncbi:hypothetical protein EYF80_060261 [Liparis tanakae]|uniref:Uncharacterized protein n=1 Tax=Liparis tanakae TaxID=230148 RepID=A0A4Z2ELZ7_9TELE|nr:hypothetical protein EYF80_060261 [Liparis tanakae]